MPVTIQMAQPADLAGEYLKGVQTAAQIRAEQDRLDQQSQQEAARLQMAAQQDRTRMQQAQEQHQVQQQRIAVTAAYNKEKATLRKQQLDQVAAVNAQRTASAAKQFEARQTWQREFSQIEADPNLTPEQKSSAKTSAVMRLAPMMGIPGTEAASMIREMRPPKPTVPANVEDRGDFLQITQPTGAVQIHNKPRDARAAGEKDPNVKVILEDQMPPTTMSRSQALRVIPGLPPELQTNAVNRAVTAGVSSPGAADDEPERPKTQKEFDAVSSGRTYVNPKDGKIYRKK